MGLFRRLLDGPAHAPVPTVATRDVQVVEHRDPTAATKALRWVSPGRAQPPDWDAAVAFQRAYYVNVVVYACIRALAEVISGLKFRVGADPEKPNDYDPNARLARLLGPPPGGPAPKLSARRLWAWTVAQRAVTGRNGWEIELGDDGKPIALWPLASSALTPIPTANGAQWFAGFVYGRPGDPEPRRLPVERVVYDWSPSGLDFRQPESDLQAAHLDINVATMQSRYDFAFLKNDARPPAIVVTEEFENDDAYEAFKSSFEARHAGPDNAGRMAFVETKGAGDQGVKGAIAIETLGFSPKDAQAAQRHQAAMLHTAMALGTPWSVLDASGRTFDNASQEWRNYLLLKVLPRCADFADMANMQLAPMIGDGNVGWFDLSPFKLEEWESISPDDAGALYAAKLITRNEGRAVVGFPAVDGGDDFAPDPPPPPAPVVPMPTGEEAGDETVTGGDPDDDTRQAEPPGAPEPPPARSPRAPTAEEVEARRTRLWTATDRTVRNLERIFERGMRRLFARQARSVLARLEAKRGRALVRDRHTRELGDEIFDPTHWAAETENAVRDYFEAITAAGGARLADRFDLAFDVAAPYAQAFIGARANQLAGQVTQTTYEQIQRALADGVAAGEGVPDLAARIRDVFEQADAVRSVRIARTETISAYNGSAAAVAAELGAGVVGAQEWIATRDSRVRDSHASVDGEVIGVGETFSLGLAYPGDPSGPPDEVVNCRCTVGFLTPDEAADALGRAPVVDVRTARALLALVAPGRFDEHVFRAAAEAAA